MLISSCSDLYQKPLRPLHFVGALLLLFVIYLNIECSGSVSSLDQSILIEYIITFHCYETHPQVADTFAAHSNLERCGCESATTGQVTLTLCIKWTTGQVTLTLHKQNNEVFLSTGRAFACYKSRNQPQIGRNHLML